MQENFSDILEQALQGNLEYWKWCSKGYLAWIIVMDQFTRHIYRHESNREELLKISDECALAAAKVKTIIEKKISVLFTVLAPPPFEFKKLFLTMGFGDDLSSFSHSRKCFSDGFRWFEFEGGESNKIRARMVIWNQKYSFFKSKYKILDAKHQLNYLVRGLAVVQFLRYYLKNEIFVQFKPGGKRLKLSFCMFFF